MSTLIDRIKDSSQRRQAARGSAPNMQAAAAHELPQNNNSQLPAASAQEEKESDDELVIFWEDLMSAEMTEEDVQALMVMNKRMKEDEFKMRRQISHFERRLEEETRKRAAAESQLAAANEKLSAVKLKGSISIPDAPKVVDPDLQALRLINRELREQVTRMREDAADFERRLNQETRKSAAAEAALAEANETLAAMGLGDSDTTPAKKVRSLEQVVVNEEAKLALEREKHRVESENRMLRQLVDKNKQRLQGHERIRIDLEAELANARQELEATGAVQAQLSPQNADLSRLVKEHADITESISAILAKQKDTLKSIKKKRGKGGGEPSGARS